MLNKFLKTTLLVTLLPCAARAACDCGSVDADSPCTGQIISATVDGNSTVDTQYTWSFNSGGGDARCGQFANGDYWVAPAVGQSTVTVTGIASPNSTITAAANPNPEAVPFGTGVNNYGNYDPAKNIITALPLSYSTTTSLVAGSPWNESTDGTCGTGISGECMASYHVVTILGTVPAKAGSETIRPNITGETKEILTFDDFDFSRIPQQPFLAGADAAGLSAIKRRWAHSTEIFSVWNESGNVGGYCSEGGRAFRAKAILPDYGGSVARTWNDDMLRLFSDDNTIADKKPALASMLAYGLDLYHTIYDSPVGLTRTWGVGAGQHLGKFLPTVFLAALAEDTGKSTMLKTAAAHIRDSSYQGPTELAQIWAGPNGPVWGDKSTCTGATEQGAYWNDLWLSRRYDGATGTETTIGEKTQQDPYNYIDGPDVVPGGMYMDISYAIQRSMLALAYMMPELYPIINYPLLSEYVLRLQSSGLQTLPDPCVTPDSREVVDGGCSPYNNRASCTYYGVTWGPVDINSSASGCITSVTPGYTQQGRFASRNGSTFLPNSGYTSAQVESNWAAIMDLGPPYVPPGQARRLSLGGSLIKLAEPGP